MGQDSHKDSRTGEGEERKKTEEALWSLGGAARKGSELFRLAAIINARNW